MAQTVQEVLGSVSWWLNPFSWIMSKESKPAGLPVANSSKSFWHSEPNEFLTGHRTTDNLPAYADVVIIGSGITGTSAARYLCNDERVKDAQIVMLEAREACWGATGRVRLSSSVLLLSLLMSPN